MLFPFLERKKQKKNVDLGGASTKLRGRGKEREIIRRCRILKKLEQC
jgi:hypothetical protein